VTAYDVDGRIIEPEQVDPPTKPELVAAGGVPAPRPTARRAVPRKRRGIVVSTINTPEECTHSTRYDRDPSRCTSCLKIEPSVRARVAVADDFVATGVHLSVRVQRSLSGTSQSTSKRRS
jgi:hypothetical protein